MTSLADLPAGEWAVSFQPPDPIDWTDGPRLEVPILVMTEAAYAAVEVHEADGTLDVGQVFRTGTETETYRTLHVSSGIGDAQTPVLIVPSADLVR